jgi:hypothetical protein
MMLPAEQVEAMLAGAKPQVRRHTKHPLVTLVEGLTQRPVREIELTAPGVRLRAR